MIADLHALTVEHDPARLRSLTGELLATLLACGVDPLSTPIYVQSDVPEHAELHYLLECATGYGEAARMIQFRQKAAGPEPVRLSLLTYPVLMAADILLHDADEVPVGDDQTPAPRVGSRRGEPVQHPLRPHVRRAPRGSSAGGRPGHGPGRPDRQDGQVIHSADSGLIFLLDRPDLVRRKVSRAVTDSGGEIAYDPDRKPGGVEPAGDPGRM